MFRRCSNDSSVLCRCPTPRRRTCGPCGLSLLPPSCESNLAAGVREVSRFSCMKFLGVPGVFDYARLSGSSRYRARSCCLPCITRTSASGLHLFGAEYPPRLSSVYASLSTSRYPAQDSRPSGSLLLSRKELSSSASCRFIPAHRNRDFAPAGLSFRSADHSASDLTGLRFQRYIANEPGSRHR